MHRCYYRHSYLLDTSPYYHLRHTILFCKYCRITFYLYKSPFLLSNIHTRSTITTDQSQPIYPRRHPISPVYTLSLFLMTRLSILYALFTTPYYNLVNYYPLEHSPLLPLPFIHTLLIYLIQLFL